jgi:hypothetical protein
VSIDFAASEYNLDADGSLTYRAGASAAGLVKHIRYQAVAGNGQVATAVATVVIDPPHNRSDSYNVRAGEQLTVAAPGILANDTAPNEAPVTRAILVSQDFAASQWTWGGGDGSFSFHVAAGTIPGTLAHFTYIPVEADGWRLPPVTVTITVYFQLDRTDAYSVRAGEQLIVPAPGILANDTATNESPITSAILVSQDFAASQWTWGGGDGSFTFHVGAGTIPGTLARFTYIPVEADGWQLPPTTVSITVTDPYDRTDAYSVIAGDQLVVPASGILANDTGPNESSPVTRAILVSQDFAASAWTWGGGDGSFTFEVGADTRAGTQANFTYIPVEADGWQLPPVTVTIIVTDQYDRKIGRAHV